MKFYIFNEKIFAIMKSIRRTKDRQALLQALLNNIFNSEKDSNVYDVGSVMTLSPEMKLIFKMIFSDCQKVATADFTLNQSLTENVRELFEDDQYTLLWALARHYFDGKEPSLTNMLSIIYNLFLEKFNFQIEMFERRVQSAKKAAESRWSEEPILTEKGINNHEISQKPENKPLNEGVIHNLCVEHAPVCDTDATSMRQNAPNFEKFSLIKGSTPPKLNLSKDRFSNITNTHAREDDDYPNFKKFCRLYPYGHRRYKAKAFELWRTYGYEDDADYLFDRLRFNERFKWHESRYIPNIHNFLTAYQAERNENLKRPIDPMIEFIKGKWIPGVGDI